MIKGDCNVIKGDCNVIKEDCNVIKGDCNIPFMFAMRGQDSRTAGKQDD